MNIEEYSRNKDGEKYVENNFQLKEFACNDGSDYFKMDTDLYPCLQRFRDYVETGVYISSAYRNEEYNREVGGANGSYHTLGQAVDIPFDETFNYLHSPYDMAKFFKTIKMPSIILYDWGIHIDTRPYENYIKQVSGGYENIEIGKVYIPLYRVLKKGVERGEDIGILQFMLQRLGYDVHVTDYYDDATERAVYQYQANHGLGYDGQVYTETWDSLIG